MAQGKFILNTTSRYAFSGDESGSINIMAAVLLIPIIGVIALAVEGGIVKGTRVQNQYAADIAAMAGAADYSVNFNREQAERVGLSALQAAGYGTDSTTLSLTVTPPATANEPAQVQANVETTHQYFLAQVFGVPATQQVPTQAVVALGGGTTTACILALGNSGGTSITGTGGTDVSALGCGVGANGNINVNGGSDFLLENASSTGNINVQGGSNITTQPQPNNINEDAAPVTDPYVGFPPLTEKLGRIGTTLTASAPAFPPASLFEDFNVPRPFQSTTQITFQGKTLTRGSDLVWVAEPGEYFIDDYRATGFNQKVRFTGTPGNPSTVWIRGDANLGFGAELHLENTDIISRGLFRHNGGGNPMEFGDGDITFTEIIISGTSQLNIGDGDVNITEDGLNVGGSSRVTIGNGEKRIQGDVSIGGQAVLNVGSGDMHVRGDFEPSGSSTFILNEPSTGSVNLFVSGDYVGGASGLNVFTNTNFFVDGDLTFRPSLRVTSTNAQFFASGIGYRSSAICIHLIAWLACHKRGKHHAWRCHIYTKCGIYD